MRPFRAPDPLLLITLLTALLVSTGLSAAERKVSYDHLWSLGATGGWGLEQTHQSFLQNARRFHGAMKNLGVHDDRHFTYFGENERSCYLRESDEQVKKVQQAKKKFIAHPSDCSLAEPLFEFTFGEAEIQIVCDSESEGISRVEAVGDFDGDGKIDISPSSRSEILIRLNQMTTDIPKGHHLILNLDDHGELVSDGMILKLGEVSEFLSPQDLEAPLRNLREKGVIVHLNVQSCYSGNFNSLTGSGVCTTASAAKNRLGYYADALISNTFESRFLTEIEKRGNHLEAFACALGASSIGTPTSSLDEVIERWKNRVMARAANSGCGPESPESAQAWADEMVSTLSKDSKLKDLRKKLRAEFDRLFEKAMRACQKNPDADAAFSKKLGQCIQDPRAGLPPEVQASYADLFGGDTIEQYRKDLIAQHRSFIDHGDAQSIEEYKGALCCLAADLRTGKAPALCATHP